MALNLSFNALFVLNDLYFFFLKHHTNIKLKNANMCLMWLLYEIFLFFG